MPASAARNTSTAEARLARSEQGDEEAGAEGDDEEAQRLQQDIYHFDSVHSSMLSVFVSW